MFQVKLFEFRCEFTHASILIQLAVYTIIWLCHHIQKTKKIVAIPPQNIVRIIF